MKLLNTIKNILRITRFDRVLRNFTQGRNFNSFIGKMVPNLDQYPPGSLRKIWCNNINFEVDLHDYYGHLLFFGFNDPSQKALFDLCKPGDVLLDIGTNIGYSLLNMAKISGSNGQVLGFEPDPVNFRRLQKNISLNDFGNISVSPVGLGDKPGNFKLENIVEFNSGGKRIVAEGNTPLADYTEVEIDTLDNFLSAKFQLPEINLIKIDVEGFELNVLKGAAGTLKKYSPVLFIELDDDNLRKQAASAHELIHFLSEIGYEIIHAENKTTVSKSDDFSHCHYDIICRKKSRT